MEKAAGADHLDEAVRPLLQRDDAQRIACIDRDLWIGYGRAQEAHRRLDRILRSERRIRPDNLLVVGASNNGKTAIARRFLSRHAVPENPSAEHGTIPVAFVKAPTGPRIPPLLFAILQALGRTAARRSTIAQTREETYRAMRDVGLRLLLIDDLHNITGSGTGPILVDLRTMGSVTGVSLGCFATKEIVHIFQRDEQLANRFELLTLPRWQLDDLDYAKLLATFARQMPLRRASNLTDPSLAAHILTAAGGLIGGVASILRQAAVEAIRTGHERIDRQMIDRARGALPEHIEALADARDL